MPSLERDRNGEGEKSSLGADGHATVPSPPFSSQDCRHVHAYEPGVSFMTTWKSSDVTITSLNNFFKKGSKLQMRIYL